MRIDPVFAKKNIQKYMWDCGVATVAFALRQKGYKVNYKKLTSRLSASAGRGTDLVKIVEFFKGHPEFFPRAKQHWNFEEIKNELRNNKVLLVAYQNWERPKDVGKPDWGHYGVIYEIEDGRIKLFDPGSFTGLAEYSREEFDKRWYENDNGIHYTRWALSLDIEPVIG